MVKYVWEMLCTLCPLLEIKNKKKRKRNVSISALSQLNSPVAKQLV